MKDRFSFSMRGKSELTKKRHTINVLMKRAMKGGKQAKDKLYKEFGIRVYSSEEVEEYVQERLQTEVANQSLPEVRARGVSRGMPRRKKRQLARKR
jgi:RNase H-fold protein (predicted Holliday junction resolvase)